MGFTVRQVLIVQAFFMQLFFFSRQPPTPTDTMLGPDLGSLPRLVCYVTAIHNLLLTTSPASGGDTDFYKPPSACLTGPSCHNCIDTLEFRSHRVCCYQCRLDNLVMTDYMCHCIDTRLPGARTDLRGNCSSGQACDNCSVRISSDTSEGSSDTPGTTNYCCQDCGIARPNMAKDADGCHCAADLQGRQHETVPRYDPPNFTLAPDSKNSGTSVRQFTLCSIWTAVIWNVYNLCLSMVVYIL